MQEKILQWLCCPINKKKLELIIFEKKVKEYSDKHIEEYYNALLKSETGWIYPVVNGIPRMQLDAFLEYEDFLINFYKDYKEEKDNLIKHYGRFIDNVIVKTHKTKKSFGMEWSIFKYETDTTWGWNKETRKKRFLDEIQIEPSQLKGKILIDIGCGNGVLTSALAEYGMETIGFDVSPSVEAAYINNKNPNTHFLQADLQNPPFHVKSFDIIYSSGVIHHTNNTELSFSCISTLVKPKGRLYVWLYKPEKDFRHNFLINLRRFTNKLPIWMQYIFYLIFLVPQGMLKEKLRGKKITWREQLISYFDVLSCKYRFEHTPYEVEIWYRKRNFSNVTVSISEYLGFGIYGDLL